ncbi:MAG TPA: ribosome maturation factor RimP [Bryobacteraceae bacterium]
MRLRSAKWLNGGVAAEKWAKAHFFVALNVTAMLTAEKIGLIDRITELGERVTRGTGIEIAEVQLRGGGKARLLRVYIDKPGGVTHGDCELVSERLGKLLDDEDAVPGDSYTLEVSSLGVERNLSKPRDFERVVGQKIRLAVREPVQGQTRFEGTLAQFAGETLELEVAPGEIVRIPFHQVQKAKLKFEW